MCGVQRPRGVCWRCCRQLSEADAAGSTSCGRGACFLRSESSVRDLHSRESRRSRYVLQEIIATSCASLLSQTRAGLAVSTLLSSSGSIGARERQPGRRIWPPGALEGGLPCPEYPVLPLSAPVGCCAVKCFKMLLFVVLTFPCLRLVAGLPGRVRSGVVRCSWPWLVADREGVSIQIVMGEPQR